MLLHLVSASEADVAETYKIIRKELGAYDMDLTKKKEIVILSRTDLVTPDEMKKKQKELEKACGQKIMTISLFDDESVKSFSDNFIKILRA